MSFYFIIPIFIIVLYFAPALEAWRAKKTNVKAIFWLNLLLGWTFIGWVVALVWSLTKDPNSVRVAEKAVEDKQNKEDRPFYEKAWFWVAVVIFVLLVLPTIVALIEG